MIGLDRCHAYEAAGGHPTCTLFCRVKNSLFSQRFVLRISSKNCLTFAHTQKKKKKKSMHQTSKSKTIRRLEKFTPHPQGKTEQNKHLQSNRHQW